MHCNKTKRLVSDHARSKKSVAAGLSTLLYFLGSIVENRHHWY